MIIIDFSLRLEWHYCTVLSCSLGLVVFSESWYIWRSPVHVVTVGLAHLPDECWLLRILHSQHHVQCVDRGQEEVAHALYWGRG